MLIHAYLFHCIIAEVEGSQDSSTHENGSQEVMYFENYDLMSVVIPVDIEALQQLLIETEYDWKETVFY